MTEGIIQKVFRRFDHPLYFYGYKNDIEQLEQALIAEIENIKPVWEHRLSIEYIKQLLIGDSE